MHCWARYLFIAVVVLLGTLSMMSACGRKGPLYLPDKPAPGSAPPSADVPALPPATDQPPSRAGGL